ncbi:DUF1934 domain-containing protein [Paenibacillus radicis (ex Xue et al. 2023)]|uniref:DUF1934 domain-containing protein n=1 Tax=Paenibacillus radicis (ex Xue et al. 2023) TaxID=2972489 RepID=A0ABT1YSJ0_9BACL|nr:DUF1934 domain-containing protein [Paenibacillus radicis (ex Xue et al. 2023)]MCR8636158.1 DUF1934 domain-containing protein [Paenibacillus radicis (ex Xue et al. 2023)]
MNTPMKVHILIDSFIEDQHIAQNADGDLYLKGNHYYLRYNEEAPEMEGTVTIIKLGQDSIRILRQGSLRSEQTFIKGQRLNGYYDTPQGKLDMETLTESLAINLTGGLGTAEWSYELFVMGDRAGVYKLRLTVTAK